MGYDMAQIELIDYLYKEINNFRKAHNGNEPTRIYYGYDEERELKYSIHKMQSVVQISESTLTLFGIRGYAVREKSHLHIC